MKKIITILLLVLALGCKKNTDTKSSNSTAAIKLNPNNCSVTEMYTTNGSSRTLTHRDYFRGETLDSSTNYSNGTLSGIIIYSSYILSYHEGRNYDAQRKLQSVFYQWYDANMRITRIKAENANGTLLYDYSYDYSCQ